MEDDVNWMLTSTLLHSDGSLHLLQGRGNGECRVMSLSRLTEKLKEIESVLSTWSQKDVFFSSLSTPTAGLVAVLSDAASDDTWNDEYLCVNATVTKAKKVKDGFQLTGLESRAIWSLNTRDNKVRHVFLSHDFTLVASVTIEGTSSEKTPLLTATLGDTNSNHTTGILYTADNKWVTMFEGKKTKKESGTMEPKKEHQVALTLHGKKVFFCIDGKFLVEEEVLPTDEAPLGPAHFCFGACGQKGHNEER
ncbi:Sialidase 85-1.3 [Trypanosoma cruzi Dm28c]|uniref:Sialidase 85-1.3 n=1 Tax=Trypanosoma cruzi Dm28c TaxID=1416333 RepID=V5A3N7_TRYCR|nr:Sialidase 85-1.3 [Trypanosoma cruzi Dm28c]